MRATIIYLLILLTSCGDKSSGFKLGKTTRSELVAVKGEPLKEEALPVKDSKVMVYEGEEKYQLKGDIVVNSFKNPTGNEKSLIYWKHKFKDCLTSSQALPQAPEAHTPPEIELSCSEQGLAVIYSQGSDLVSRVVEYEIK